MQSFLVRVKEQRAIREAMAAQANARGSGGGKADSEFDDWEKVRHTPDQTDTCSHTHHNNTRHCSD